MEVLNEDLIINIISRLPVKLAIQCKILCKSLNYKLCEPSVTQNNASQWFEDEKISNKVMIYSPRLSSKYQISKFLCNVSINRGPRKMSITSPLDVSVLASCKGLLFLDFHQIRILCVFNPSTGAHQLIPYPEPRNYFKIIESEGGGEGLLVDYPNSGEYKLVIVRKLDDQPRGGYIFNVFSSSSSSSAGLMWHESKFRSKFCNASLIGHAVYLHGCLHWLRSDGNVVVFDTTRGHRIINMPEVIKSYVRDPLYGIISFRFHSWMGETRGLLTLVCAFEKLIVILTYDYYESSSNWTVSHTLANFNPDLGFLDHGVPMWFDGEKLLFLVKHSSASKSGYLYEYDSDSEIKKVHDHVISDIDTIKHFFSFEPTLANVVVPLLPYKIRAEYRRHISTTLADLKCLLTGKSTVTEETPVNKFPYLN